MSARFDAVLCQWSSWYEIDSIPLPTYQTKDVCVFETANPPTACIYESTIASSEAKSFARRRQRANAYPRQPMLSAPC